MNPVYMNWLKQASDAERYIFSWVLNKHPNWTTGIQITAVKLVHAAAKAGCTNKPEAVTYWREHNLI